MPLFGAPVAGQIAAVIGGALIGGALIGWARNRGGTMRSVATWILLAVVFAVGALPPWAALARPAAYGMPMALPPPVAVSPVVVTPQRFAQQAFEADRSLQTVDADALREQQASSGPEALEEVTGVLMQKTNRGAGAPILRGLIGPNNLLVIDGVRFNNATFRTGPNQYMTMLDPVSFSRFEVMMGPASVLYGSDAMGGVVHAVPHDWSRDKNSEGEVGLRFGSADLATSVWGRAAWQADGVGVQAGAALRRFGELRAGGGEVQPISGYGQGSWNLRGTYTLAPGAEVRAAWYGTRVKDAGRADAIAKGDFRFYDNDDDVGIVELRYEAKGKGLRQGRLAAVIHRTAERVDRYRCDVGDSAAGVGLCAGAGVAQRGGAFGTGGEIPAPDAPLTRNSQNGDTVWSPGGLALAQWALAGGALLLNAGVEGQVDRVTDSTLRERRADKDWAWKDGARGNFSGDSTYATVAAFAMLEFDLLEWGDNVLVSQVGSRLSHFRASAAAVPGVGDLDYDHTGVIGSVGLRLLRGRNLMAYLNGSQGFRAPNLQEVTTLGDTGSKFEVPNGDLGPERSDAVEIGGRWRKGDAEIHAAAYVNMVQDFIDEQELEQSQWQQLGIDPAEVGTKPVVQRVNSSFGLFYGGEATVRAPRMWRVQPWLRAAWIHTEVDRKGETVPSRRSPPLLGAGGLRYDAPDKRWHLGVFSRFAGAQDELHPSDERDLRICADPDNPSKTYKAAGKECPGTPAWWTLNVRGGYAFTKQLRLDASLNNALDANYRSHGSGYDEAGVGVAASLVGQF